jgi:hypothetical protein
MSSIRIFLGALWIFFPAFSIVGAETPAQPPSQDEVLSTDYSVTMDGQSLPVHLAKSVHGGDYSFASFDFSRPVVVAITGKAGIEHAVIRPASKAVEAKREENKLTLTIKEPCQLSIEPNGIESPLLLFADPAEKEKIQAGSDNVIYFGPGVHHAGKIELKSNQTLYLAAGAVVKAAVTATNAENVRICGRGILDGTDWPWLKGPAGQMVELKDCRNVTVEDIVIRGSFAWTLVPMRSEQVTIRNVKILGSRVQNDDGIDICNSQNVTIEDCFVRTDDDCIALKGLFSLAKDNPAPVRNLAIRRCIFWCDRARIFLLGHESVAPTMDQIQVTDSDIVHYRAVAFLLEPGEEMLLANVSFENIRVASEDQPELIRLRPTVNQYMHLKQPGHISNITFDGINVTRKSAVPLKIQVMGADDKHGVDGVVFRNVEVNGSAVEQTTPGVEIGEHTSNIRLIAK